jgi:hypothetical protein
MRPQLSIHEAAETELNEAADFYDSESLGLGNAFLNKDGGVDIVAYRDPLGTESPRIVLGKRT